MQTTNVFMQVTMRENMLQSGEDVQFLHIDALKLVYYTGMMKMIDYQL